MNANTFAYLLGAPSPAQGALAIPAYVPVGTSATILTNQLGGAAVLNVGAGQLVSGAAAQPSFAVNFDGTPFRLRINGKITTGASTNLTVAIQVGNSTTVVAGNTIATTGSLAVNTTSANFQLECVCIWDNVSQKLQGAISPMSWVNATAVSAAVLTGSNAVAVTTQAGLTFVPVITVSATTTVTITISEFTAENV